MWLRNIVLKNPLSLYPTRTDNAFCITLLSPIIWLPKELEATVTILCAEEGAMWEAMALLRRSVEWARKHRATRWNISSETEYDLTPLARRLGAKDKLARCTMRLAP